jgi:hypothetical protein
MDADETSGRVSPCRSVISISASAPCTGPDPHPDGQIHGRINLLMSQLDEQRGWYAAVESANFGHGGDRWLSQITGLHVDTIRRGREELAYSLEGRPAD